MPAGAFACRVKSQRVTADTPILKVHPMRLLFVIVVGAFLTIGATYVHDNWKAPSETTGSSSTLAQRPMVNWDVVSANWSGLRQRARETWTALSHKISS